MAPRPIKQSNESVYDLSGATPVIDKFSTADFRAYRISDNYVFLKCGIIVSALDSDYGNAQGVVDVINNLPFSCVDSTFFWGQFNNNTLSSDSLFCTLRVYGNKLQLGYTVLKAGKSGRIVFQTIVRIA